MRALYADCFGPANGQTIQKTIDAAAGNSAIGAVVLGARDYSVCEPIRIDLATGQRNIRIIGANAAGKDSDRTRLIWDSAVPGDIFEVTARNCMFEHLEAMVAPGKSALSAFRFYPSTVPSDPMPSFEQFRYCTIAGNYDHAHGAFESGVVIDNDGKGNHDHFRFVACTFKDIGPEINTGKNGAIFRVTGASGQSVKHGFWDCIFRDEGTAHRGTAIEMVKGGFRAFNCFFRGLERLVHVGSSEEISLYGCEAENFKRLIDTSLGGASVSAQICYNVFGGAYHLDKCEPSVDFEDGSQYGGKVIYCTHAGPVNLHGVQFGKGPNYYDWFKVISDGSSGNPGAINAYGCRFPNDIPFGVQNIPVKVISSGNEGLDSSASKISLPDYKGYLHKTGERNITTISGGIAKDEPSVIEAQRLVNAVPSNLSGEVVFTEGEVEEVVNLAFEEPTTGYKVQLAIECPSPSPGVRGTPPASGLPGVYVSEQQIGYFVIALTSAPGQGEEVKVKWGMIG